jgi:hypothetical protein
MGKESDELSMVGKRTYQWVDDDWMTLGELDDVE